MVSQIAAGSSASGYPDVYVAGFLLGNCHGLFAWRISFIVKKALIADGLWLCVRTQTCLCLFFYKKMLLERKKILTLHVVYYFGCVQRRCK